MACARLYEWGSAVYQDGGSAFYIMLGSAAAEMDTFNTVASAASIAGFVFSVVAAIQAGRASKAASAARDAALIRSLADEMLLACLHAEQLQDFLQHARYSESSLRVDELTSSLSELPRRRSPHLSTTHQNSLLTSRHQLQTIGEAILKSDRSKAGFDREQVMTVARSVVMNLREVLGDIRSGIEHGEPQ